jgi:hypothetical protein
MPQLKLDAGDAAELAETLILLREWLAADHGLAASLARHVGHPAYGIPQLCDDLDRFTFLLGGSDGEHLFAGNPRNEQAEQDPDDN